MHLIKGDKRLTILLVLFSFFHILSSLAFSSIKKSNLIREWKSIDAKIQRILTREGELSEQKLNLELALNEATENIQFLSQSIKERRDLVLNRIRYLNRDSGAVLLRNLMESSNPGALDRQLKYISLLTESDVDLIKQFNKDLSKIEQERSNLARRISKLNETQRQLKVESETYLSELEKKNLILSKVRRKLKHDATAWNRELQLAIKNNNKEKINFYQSLLNKNLLDRKGQLISPSESNIKYRFGVIKLSPKAPTLPFQGLLFQNTVGSPVRAIADGKIAWVGSIPGLGDTLILDHGRDLHSIYSRVQLANKQIGDMIEEGATFTKVILSSGQLDAGLYFEIREHGRPTDPLRWILTKQEILSKDSTPWENMQ